MTGASEAGRREGVGIQVAGGDVDTAGCLTIIRRQGIRVGFREGDEEDVRDRRRIGMEVEVRDQVLVTGR